nr:PIN domain-containing protein [Stenotrophomonas rhizophila]
MIVLDTNVLLNLYRVSNKARREVMAILDSQKDRLWIPYQVAAEFQRNRLKALREEYDKAKALAANVNKAHAAFRQSIQSVQFNERGGGEEVDAVMKKIADNVSELSQLAGKLADGYLSPNEADGINDFLTELFNGRIGARPRDQDELEALYQEAEARYAVGMGPGHLDRAKAGDKYMIDGLIYDRQYGDYVLWTQLLAHVDKVKPDGILLITSDVKEDWWLDTKSVSGLRPQPELVMDVRRRGCDGRFWMYTLSDFVKKSKKYLDSSVSEDTISDVEQADQIAADSYVVDLQLKHSMRDASGGLTGAVVGIGMIGDALGAVRFRVARQGFIVASVPLGDGKRMQKYALVNVSTWPKENPSLEGLDNYIAVAESAVVEADAVVLYGSDVSVEFWSRSRWATAVAFRISAEVPYPVLIQGASFTDDGAVLTTILDERNGALI